MKDCSYISSMIRFIATFFLVLILATCSMTPTPKKITGVSLEMPPKKIGREAIKSLKMVNAEWVAMIPFAFSRPTEPSVIYHSGHWWGESEEGVEECIRLAQEEGLKVMLKPQVWVSGQGWPGDYDLKDEDKWKKWERNYTTYIMAYANVAKEYDVELYCIGTEYRKSAAQRPEYWRGLIKKVREVYKGEITYAANWDNYHNVKFWDDLDYIGVDAYFPLSNKAKPSMEELKVNWKKVESNLKGYSEEYERPILFTEYGYKSIEYTNSGHWNYQEDTVKTSMQAQVTAYEALFQSVWQKNWMAGGFFWKWHVRNDREIGGAENRRYTPQGKPSADVIAEWYGKSN